MSDPESVWGWVAEERRILADDLQAVDRHDWDRPSLCAGWRVRDVIGHLVWLAEATRFSVFADTARQLRPPMQAVARIATQVGSAPPEQLIDRLRAGADGRFVLPTLPPAMALGEVLTHRIDALRPIDGPARPTDDRTRLAVEAYVPITRVLDAGPTGRVRFVATDATWSVGPAYGAQATGPGEAILLAAAGRPEGVADLTGPGATLLTR